MARYLEIAAAYKRNLNWTAIRDVPDLEKTIEELSKFLDISPESQKKFFNSLKRKRRFKPAELYPSLSDQQVSLFSVN